MTPEQIAEEVTGYVDGYERVLRDTDMTSDQLDEILLDLNIEQCPDCGWYVDSFELLNDDDIIDGHCDNCRN